VSPARLSIQLLRFNLACVSVFCFPARNDHPALDRVSSLNIKKMTKIILIPILAACAAVEGFAPSRHRSHRLALPRSATPQRVPSLRSSPEPTDEADAPAAPAAELTAEEEEEEKKRVGNLVADEEWNGLSLELADIIRMAVVEDLKKNSREFLGKEEYLLGDFSKELDKRVKAEVAKIREKDDYEVSVSVKL
jgi:hypothetical protein